PPTANELLLDNGADQTGTPFADGGYTGGSTVRGVLTGTGGPPTFIYEFSSDQAFNIYGADGGPDATFNHVDIYSGTPFEPDGPVVTGQFFCGCGPGTGEFSLTTVNETWVFNGPPLFGFTITP